MFDLLHVLYIYIYMYILFIPLFDFYFSILRSDLKIFNEATIRKELGFHREPHPRRAVMVSMSQTAEGKVSDNV